MLLLAIADNANDDGFCWPGFPALARKIRLSERHVMRLAETLNASKELYIAHPGIDGSGKRKTNEYIITLLHTPQSFAAVLQKQLNKTVSEAGEIAALFFPPDKMSPLTSCQGGGDTCVRGGVTHVSPKPSLTPNEPSQQQQKESDGQNIFTIYENEIGGLSPLIADRLKEAEKTYPFDWIVRAMRRAAEMNKRRWAYVEGILKNWQKIGGPQNDKGRNTKKTTPLKSEITSEDAREQFKNW